MEVFPAHVPYIAETKKNSHTESISLNQYMLRAVIPAIDGDANKGVISVLKIQP